MRLAAALLLGALALAAPAGASEERPTLAELETELYCPTCASPLDQSDAPIAQRMKAYVSDLIAEGRTKGEIKEEMVAQFGERVLAAPPRRGFNLLAWVLPFAGLLVGGGAVGFAAWRWSRGREDAPAAGGADPALNGRSRLDPELDRRLDEALARYDD
ncbi:MAG: cytochrome c-type biogenesis protein CcmH [Actinobacteria bacterium]|nr:cytochrome c-type biogenesis protein CcmH [Actinomycetota bacterium]